MKKKLLAMILLPVAALSFVACGGDKTQEGNKEDANSSAVESEYKDGTYEVETKEADKNGGKARVSVEFKDGKIIEVKYNEFNDKGDKRDNKEYNDMMKEKAGISPSEYEVKIEEAVMEKQSAQFDAITGATSSSSKAKTLIDEAISNAKDGKTEKTLVEVN